MRSLSRSETLSEITSEARQAGAVSLAQGCLIFKPGGSIEQSRHFLWTEDHGQLARLANEMGVLDDIVALERDAEEEPQCRDGLIDGRHAYIALRQMQRRREPGRAAEAVRSQTARGHRSLQPALQAEFEREIFI